MVTHRLLSNPTSKFLCSFRQLCLQHAKESQSYSAISPSMRDSETVTCQCCNPCQFLKDACSRSRSPLNVDYQPPEIRPNSTGGLCRAALSSTQTHADAHEGFGSECLPAFHRRSHRLLRGPMELIGTADAAPKLGDRGQNGDLVPIGADTARITPAHPDPGVV